MNKPLIILDRDGVINYDSEEYIKSPEEWLAIPGSLDAIAELNHAGFLVIVVTNQSGVGRGLYSLDTLQQIHQKLKNELAKVNGHIDDIFFCPHSPIDNCECRKPKPGMLYKIRDKYQINLNNIYFIGDSRVDMQAAIQVECKPILVLTGNGLKTKQENPELAFVETFADLRAAVKYILKKQKA